MKSFSALTLPAINVGPAAAPMPSSAVHPIGITDRKIARVRLYIEPVEVGGEDFEASAKRATR